MELFLLCLAHSRRPQPLRQVSLVSSDVLTTVPEEVVFALPHIQIQIYRRRMLMFNTVFHCKVVADVTHLRYRGHRVPADSAHQLAFFSRMPQSPLMPFCLLLSLS
jgi:hypothetical protein